MKRIYFFVLLFAITQCLQAQSTDLALNVKLYNEKINELLNVKQNQGFELIREERLLCRAGFDFELNLALQQKTLYALVMVGDPSSYKIVSSLGNAELGFVFTDRLRTLRDNEFWTEFQFPCELAGWYIFTINQKNKEILKPLAYFMLFKKVK
jgi:hypothetical protein